jgi:hypothetical protein
MHTEHTLESGKILRLLREYYELTSLDLCDIISLAHTNICVETDNDPEYMHFNDFTERQLANILDMMVENKR